MTQPDTKVDSENPFSALSTKRRRLFRKLANPKTRHDRRKVRNATHTLLMQAKSFALFEARLSK